MQLVINVKEGATNKDIAAQLRFQAGLIEGIDPKVAASRKNTDAPTKEIDSDDDDEFAKAETKTKTTRAAKAAAASFEDDSTDEETVAEVETDDDFMEPAPAKTAKKGAKKFTVNDVNDACKAKAAATDRKTVLGILKKKFGVASVTELKAEQYGDAIKAMAV